MRKSVIMLASAAVLLVTEVSANGFTTSRTTSNIAKKQKLKRVDSRARLPILKDKDLLPAPMSTEEYINMLKKFLKENNQLIDPTEFVEKLDAMESWLKSKAKWLSDLRQDFSFNPEDYPEYESFINKHKALFYQTEENTNPHLPKDTKIIDISCPNIMIWAFKLIAKDKISEEDPTNIFSDQHLKWGHLAWIVKYFADHVNKIQSHEIDPDDKYDSGLTDDEVDLLIKLTVGPNRLFNTSEMSKTERNEFTDKILTDILRNASGFQRILSLLIVSTIWHEFKQSTWQWKVSFFEGSDGSYADMDKRKLLLNKSDDFYTPFHEMTHVFHNMLDLNLMWMNLITNISIINSRNVNLVEQYFPMLRPYVMIPVLKKIENLIDKYWGHDFKKITEKEKQKLVVIVLEPIIRKAMTAGFGSFIFPNYKQNKPLAMSTDMLTTQRMAICMYLSGILEDIATMFFRKDFPFVLLASNVISSFLPVQHPVFNSVAINVIPIKRYDLLPTTECFWSSNEERLTMQGNTLISANGSNFYLQDRQNEHIYRIRSQGEKSLSYSIADQFRYHERKDSSHIFPNIALMVECCPSLNLKYEIDLKNSPQMTELKSDLDRAFQPSSETKYATPRNKS